MKFIAFHLGYGNIQDFTRVELHESAIDSNIEQMLNKLSDVQKLKIIGNVDISNPSQNVLFHDRSIATKNSVLGSCMGEFKTLALQSGLQGSYAERRKTIMNSPKIYPRYTEYVNQLSQATGLPVTFRA